MHCYEKRHSLKTKTEYHRKFLEDTLSCKLTIFGSHTHSYIQM